MKKIEKEKKKSLDKLLIEGYRSQTEIDGKCNDEWEEITLENWDE